jgi:catechol 2,3-dioxygenase-like lactoylglutathione lyase family enzyme
MKKLQRKLWAVLMVVVFLVGALVAIVPRASATPSMSTLLKPSLDSMIVPTARAGTPSVDSAMMRHASDAAEPHPNWEKLSSSLQEAALAGTGTLNTAILTDDVAQLGGYLRAHGVEIVKEPADNPPYRIYNAFARDPSGYLIEIQRFWEPLA